MRSLKLLLLNSVWIIVFCILLINLAFGGKARILNSNELGTTHGGCWHCAYGDCDDVDCHPAANGNGYSKKVGVGDKFAACIRGSGIWDICTTIEPEHCFDTYWGCDDSSCTVVCDWTQQIMPTDCDLS